MNRGSGPCKRDHSELAKIFLIQFGMILIRHGNHIEPPKPLIAKTTPFFIQRCFTLASRGQISSFRISCELPQVEHHASFAKASTNYLCRFILLPFGTFLCCRF